MLDVIKGQIDGIRIRRTVAQSRYRGAMQEVPESVVDFWQRNAHLEFKGIPQDRVFFSRALEGLLTFFACVRDSGKTCGLPSAAADSVWHAWAARSPAGLERFCIKHFGKAIPHMEEADMRPQMEVALANCMVQARCLEQRDPCVPSVPSLFALDRELRMPRGFSYELVHGAVTIQRLNALGIPVGGRRYQNGLDAVQLLGAGLISQAAYDEHVRQRQDSGGACGSAAGSAGSNCDGASSCDSGGGSDGGGGDGGGGGGCGGGCGGG